MNHQQLERIKLNFIRGLELAFDPNYHEYLADTNNLLQRHFGIIAGDILFEESAAAIDNVWSEQESDHV